MDKFIAKSISLIFSPPVILAPVPFVLVLKYSSDINDAIKWSFFFYISIFIMISVVLVGRFFGIFSDLDVSNKSERPKLLISSLIICITNCIFLILFGAPKILILMGFGVLIGILFIFIFLRWTKISIHTAAITAFAISIVLIYGRMFIPLLLLIPIMGWARITSRRHTLREVIAGGILGSVLTIIIYSIGKNFIL
ncbi:MAG: phosphatase PAP2 family protein [Patescibacteria group bacterium]